MAYICQAPSEKSFLIVLNLSHRPCYFKIQHMHIKGTVVLATAQELEGTSVTEIINLGGDEGIIVQLAL